ncbi:MAG: tetratricopeptide repeat protein [Vicinamibacterales bacterium]
MISAAVLIAAVACAGPVTPGSGLDERERAVAGKPRDVQSRLQLADVYLTIGCPIDAAAQLRTATTLAPRNPGVWYALGQAYNAVKQTALASFTSASDAPWRALISADALLENGHLTDAFALYHAALESLPSMITIHDSVARIYERTGHPQWAAIERDKIHVDADGCTARRAMCEFRAGRHQAVLDAARGSDTEARYWTARAANELALAAFKHLDVLPDSVERRTVRAARAHAQERYIEEIAELRAAIRLAGREPHIEYQLASAYYSARDYDASLAIVLRMLKAFPDESRLMTLKGHLLLQLQRPDEAVPILKDLVLQKPDDSGLRLALARAYSQTGNYAAAIPLLEEQLDDDSDGSLHMQLARAYSALGQRDKAVPLMARSEELRKQDEERRASTAKHVITAPK